MPLLTQTQLKDLPNYEQKMWLGWSLFKLLPIPIHMEVVKSSYKVVEVLNHLNVPMTHPPKLSFIH